MFKLIVIAIAVWLVWSRLNSKNKQRVKDKIAQAKSIRVDAPVVKEAISGAKEKGRSLVIQILVAVIGLLTSILSALLPSGNDNNNLPTIRL